MYCTVDCILYEFAFPDKIIQQNLQAFPNHAPRIFSSNCSEPCGLCVCPALPSAATNSDPMAQLFFLPPVPGNYKSEELEVLIEITEVD